jgi:uncharacterized protein YqjF (DUF2071 family)
MPAPFLTAVWRYLVMLNYEIDPAVLRPLVPKGTELDAWDGGHYVSVVGFRFLHARLRGLPIPFHRNFDEVNLRFYVRHRAADGWRRGVAFVKEVVPRWAIAAVARWVYNENYVACPMRSQIQPPADGSAAGRVEYRWAHRGRWFALAAEFAGSSAPLAAGSAEEFIAEHYWGYVGQRDGSTLQYRVEHPPWRVWQARSCQFECDVAEFYGEQFRAALSAAPRSAFVADGSEVAVLPGERIPAG